MLGHSREYKRVSIYLHHTVSSTSSWRPSLFTAAALTGFAANSLLTRGALATSRLDAASFTAIRLISGAVALAILSRVINRTARSRGSWISALALAGYAIAFTMAYRRIGAGVGALTLFGAVQVTMIGRGLIDGERPSLIEAAGLGCALIGLAVLTIPGASAPDLIGLGLMVIAGGSWGVYSLRGRRVLDPIGATAGNFLRASVFGVIFAVASRSSTVVTMSGIWLAIASGALASGVGYALWYAALPALTAWRAAVVQLTVPVLTALAAAALLSEPLTLRLMTATTLILVGVWLNVSQRRRGPAAAAVR